MIVVKKIMLKTAKGMPLKEVSEMNVSPDGVADTLSCLPQRQVLLLPFSTLLEFGLRPGDLRENILIEGHDLHSLESGTVISIGEADIRLTYHCEPCIKMKSFGSVKNLLHKRGYFGTFLNSGIVRTGDEAIIREKRFESIPYDIKDRIRWYLDQQTGPVSIPQLCYEVGLSRGYYRAIPGILRRMGRSLVR
jgi:MOSC domain-containing protein YiiM